MLEFVNEGKALNIAKKYFYLLKKTGYVKQSTVRKYMTYLFCLDFLKYAFPYMDEEDYVKVDRLLKRTFTNGGCLLPYNIACSNRVTLGTSGYMGPLVIRKTEDLSVDKNGNDIGYEDRTTEDDFLRTV